MLSKTHDSIKLINLLNQTHGFNSFSKAYDFIKKTINLFSKTHDFIQTDKFAW